jgi:hypothetical protein
MLTAESRARQYDHFDIKRAAAHLHGIARKHEPSDTVGERK